MTEATTLDHTAPILVVVSPNNPDGKLWPAGALIEAARRRAGQGGLIVVDEAFAEVTGACVLAGAESPARPGQPALLRQVLRSGRPASWASRSVSPIGSSGSRMRSAPGPSPARRSTSAGPLSPMRAGPQRPGAA
ncbi:MAG: aminotransferase class I/II-fold pyridoxal phosphate-dependent enzyme [Aliidongia sp.]